MRWAFVLLVVVHGLIHFLGVAKAFGLADLPQLTETISAPAGYLWLLAGLSLIVAGVLFASAPHVWWLWGLAGVALSQMVILLSWSDAKVGTIANLFVLLMAIYGLASHGWWSLRGEYEALVQSRLVDVHPTPIITEADLTPLPEPVQRYLRQAGALGQPRTTHVHARWRGRIRGTAEDPWMEFVAEQFNFVENPARFFMMDARRAGLPVDVLHVFQTGNASMRVRLLSLLPLVNSSGPDLNRAETVTLFNEMAILAPGSLLDPSIVWKPVDDHLARAQFTVASETISAELHFDDGGRLINFVSDDRLVASADGSEFTRQRWSTPLSEYRSFGPWTVATRGAGWWHPEEGVEFPYIELELLALEVNPTLERR